MKTLKTGRKWVACLLMLGGVGGMNAQNEWIEPPVMGWSSWNTYRVNIDEALIRKQADAMVELGLKESGYRYVNIDDGFSATGTRKDGCIRIRNVSRTG